MQNVYWSSYTVMPLPIKKRFGTLVHSAARLLQEDLGPLINFERQNNFVPAEEDLPCSVRIATLLFLFLSDHLTESFLTVLFC